MTSSLPYSSDRKTLSDFPRGEGGFFFSICLITSTSEISRDFWLPCMYSARGSAHSAFIYLRRAVACLRLVPISGSKIALRPFGGMNHAYGSKEIDRTNSSDALHRDWFLEGKFFLRLAIFSRRTMYIVVYFYR